MKPETYFMTAVLGRLAGQCLSRPHEVRYPGCVHPADRHRPAGIVLPLNVVRSQRFSPVAPDPVTPGVWRNV